MTHLWKSYSIIIIITVSDAYTTLAVAFGRSNGDSYQSMNHGREQKLRIPKGNSFMTAAVKYGGQFLLMLTTA